MKISYVTTYDSSDVKNWSGTGYYISKSLMDQGTELERIGNLNWNITLPLKLKKRCYKLLGKEFAIERDISIGKDLAKQVSQKISKDSNLVFSPGIIPIAFLETNKPKVFYADATLAGMLGFYDEFSNYCQESIINGKLAEQQAFDTSRLAIFASDWAAKTAIDNYNVDKSKIKIVPLGSNIESNRKLSDIKEILTNKSYAVCELLFLGVDWKRKGGDFAVEVAKLLNERGISAKLHIAGINNIPIEPLPSWIINHGFISKSTNEGKRKIDELFLNSHFLLLPTQAEAFGLVFGEANSFGVPAVTTDVGGITTAVKDGLNGTTFSLEAAPEDYADYIQKMFTDQNAYKELALSSFNEFETRLNWRVAGETIMKFLKEL
ncbi:MAG: glycosyltransferase family 4 protein [Ignavibacteria bacterium]|nr:glycosyltransferase family 4 protein [Ignavibacteria bacterium]